jgi:hypothetical protein
MLLQLYPEIIFVFNEEFYYTALNVIKIQQS